MARRKGKNRHRRRNLVQYGGVIYYERQYQGHRFKFSCETDDWDVAAAVRDRFERERGFGTALPILNPPTFKEMGAAFLETDHYQGLAPGTRANYRALLKNADSPILQALGHSEVCAITRRDLEERFWQTFVVAAGRTRATGLNYLNIISDVLGLAIDRDLLDANPVDAFRGTLRRRTRGKGARTAAQADTRHPIERVEDLAAFVAASAAAAARPGRRWKKPTPARRNPVHLGQAGHVATLILLDAGLRLGEVAGLRWRDVHWGEGPDDLRRFLHIRESISSGRWETTPKSGRQRQVDLSRRLRRVLREWWVAQGQPSEDERVLPTLHQGNYRTRHFDPVCKAAGLVEFTPKDLRDTFASQLFTFGVQLGYISRQLGHADTVVTARSYAKWIEAAGYQEPIRLLEGEQPVDLIERVCQPAAPAAEARQTLRGSGG